MIEEKNDEIYITLILLLKTQQKTQNQKNQTNCQLQLLYTNNVSMT
jgi:hypothetical protein